MADRDTEEQRELTEEEVEAQEGNELPNREAMSIIQGPLPPTTVGLEPGTWDFPKEPPLTV